MAMATNKSEAPSYRTTFNSRTCSLLYAWQCFSSYQDQNKRVHKNNKKYNIRIERETICYENKQYIINYILPGGPAGPGGPSIMPVGN
jgi:hypothetical protein